MIIFWCLLFQPDEDEEDDSEYNANVEAAQEALESRRVKEEAAAATMEDSPQPPSNDLLGLNLNDPAPPNGDDQNLMSGLGSIGMANNDDLNQLMSPPQSQSQSQAEGTADLLGGF